MQTRNTVLMAIVLMSSAPALLAESDEPALAGSSEKSGWEVDTWTIQTSLYTYHFDSDPDHVNDQNLIRIEAGFANRWLAGVASFSGNRGVLPSGIAPSSAAGPSSNAELL